MASINFKAASVAVSSVPKLLEATEGTTEREPALSGTSCSSDQTPASVSVELLMEGAVESFLDAFRFEQHAVAEQLKTAELCDNLDGKIKAYLEIAAVASQDSKTPDFPVFLIERCVQLAQDFRVSSLHALSLVALGKAEVNRGRLREAQRDFEQACEESAAGPVFKEASEAFVHTTWGLAGGSEISVLEFRRAREAALRANLGCLGECDLRLGSALHETGEFAEAAVVLRRCLEFAQTAGDRKLELQTRAALAETLEAGKEQLGAKEQLEILLNIATESGDLHSQSIGCLRLGLLLLSRVQEEQKTFGLDADSGKITQEVERGVELLEMHYDLSRQLGAQDTALARLVLGIARATYRLPQYFHAVLADLPALTSWKCRRTPLPSTRLNITNCLFLRHSAVVNKVVGGTQKNSIWLWR